MSVQTAVNLLRDHCAAIINAAESASHAISPERTLAALESVSASVDRALDAVAQ